MGSTYRKTIRNIAHNARMALTVGLFVLMTLFSLPGPVMAQAPNAAGGFTGYARYTWSPGEYYQGYFRNGLMDGTGVYVWPNGDRYSGRFVRGVKSGQGVFHWANGMMYTGSFQDDRITGTGTITWQNGEKYRGAVVDGQPNGQGTYTWPNGNSYTGTWIKGKRTSPGKYTWADGSTYEGSFVNDQPEGYGTMTWPSGDVYTGSFGLGSLFGFGNYSYRNGTQKIGYWNRGVYDKGVSEFINPITPKDCRTLKYEVTYQGKQFTIGPVNLPETLAWKFESMKKLWQRGPRMYSWSIQPPQVSASVYASGQQQDLLLAPVVHYFEQIAYQEKMTDRQLADLTVSVVRSLPGAQESVTTNFDETIQYPMETLIRGGDSEDRSLLLAVLLKKLGFDARLIYMNASQPTHAAVAIYGDLSFNGWNTYTSGKRYYYLETCAVGGKPGEIPDAWKSSSFQVISLDQAAAPSIRRVISAK
ncbi:MAG: MORN repeat-containing protein [Solirubrobacterales bacterium]